MVVVVVVLRKSDRLGLRTGSRGLQAASTRLRDQSSNFWAAVVKAEYQEPWSRKEIENQEIQRMREREK